MKNNAKNSENSQLILAEKLTKTVQQLCIGLEQGVADILDMVTPMTAELLKFWFHQDYCAARRFNFHQGQKQAILNSIYAHEVLQARHLQDLYQQVVPNELLTGNRLHEISQVKHQHPKYCLKMATGTGKTWVLQALLVWQLLNKQEYPEDKRFTRYFMIVAPGLIVYDRLLDAFCGKIKNGERDFNSSDVALYAELFSPEQYQEKIFSFVKNNVCDKENIGLKAVGGGLLAISNWHLLTDNTEIEEEEELTAQGGDIDPVRLIQDILPLTPAKTAGNSLDTLDKRFARGKVLDYLADLPELMVFNDEAHHIHEIKSGGEATEVEWQKSLTTIAAKKGRQFVQVDFSATPYNDIGSGKNKKKQFFPHIIVDFDLKMAMKAGLVKSLALDKRKEIGALPLEFKAERDDSGNPILSEGQRVMLRAGLAKLRKLEQDFAQIDSNRHPKMLVVCEDTTVSPLVTQFLQDEGLAEDEVMSVDSGKKAELGQKDWEVVRERLFDVDKHAKPRVIVSVLMLREGFDVSNICVIVPLRSSQAQILLEQTIGRGLRLMWRDAEYSELKKENRQRINQKQEPNNMLDILSIVEHPVFQDFYNDLMQDGLVGEITEDSDGTSSVGDLISVGLVENYQDYDFAIPFILQEQDEYISHQLEVKQLASFKAMPIKQLKDMLGKGDIFVSQDLLASTLFGDYRVDGSIMNVAGYNDYLSRLTRRIGQALNYSVNKGNRVSHHAANPYLQTGTVYLTAWIDQYIREQLFSIPFEPLDDENWRILLLDPVMQHIVRIFSEALVQAEDTEITGEIQINYRHLSEVEKLPMREGSSLEVQKCIYQRLSYPTRSGGLEKAFIEAALIDSNIQAFCKVSENRHHFVHLRYINTDGMPAFYSPDFLVRTDKDIYLVETKAQQQVNHPNVQRKLKAAVQWCERINHLSADYREERQWHYVLLGESTFYEWLGKNARLSEVLHFAKVRTQTNTEQLKLV